MEKSEQENRPEPRKASIPPVCDWWWSIFFDEYNEKLKFEIETLKKESEFLKRKPNRDLIISNKNRQLRAYGQREELYKKQVNWLQERIIYLRNMVAGGKTIVKKLDNLGSDFKRKKYIDIKDNDILLVKDANIFSQEAIDFLKGRNIIILYRNLSKKNEASIPCVTVTADSLEIEEETDFGAVDIKEIEKLINVKGMLVKIVQEYRERTR